MGHFPVLYDSACFFNIFGQYIFQILKFQSMCIVRTEGFVIVFEEGIGTLLIVHGAPFSTPLKRTSPPYTHHQHLDIIWPISK